MRKRPVSINFSKRILDRIDQEAKANKRSRSEWLELHFEELFFKPEQPVEIATKTG
jgi:metal-responsive CopG/Arc/MetJ family transcriptional regulator